jgi:SAM-dependent methyltransferase
MNHVRDIAAEGNTQTCPICNSQHCQVFEAQHVRAAKCGNMLCGVFWALCTPMGAGVQSIPDPGPLIDRCGRRNVQMAGLFLRRGFLGPNVRLLDYGAGSGQFTLTLRNLIPDLDIVAVEADPEGFKRLQDLGFETYRNLDEISGHFDAILLVEVIEHIDDPTKMLQQLRTRLRSGGQIFCTTPCGETRRGQRRSAAFETAEHVHFFTESSLNQCFQNAGFDNFKCETINQMTSQLSPPPIRYFKDMARPLLARIFGHTHLTGFACRA